MEKTRIYEVLISRGDDPEGHSCIDLDVDEEMLLLLIDMALDKGHRVEITKYEDVATS